MAIEIEETFQVHAPIEMVWGFLLDPQRVAPCMPGAELDEVVDERTFHGTVKIKVGAITARYKGKVQLTKVDPVARTIEMSAEGRETSGGTAKGAMASAMRALGDGRTEVVAKATVDLTGRIVQVGRGMIQGVSHQLFLQFVSAVQGALEPLAAAASPANGAAETAPPTGPRARPDAQAIRVLPLVLRVMWTALVRFFRRLLGRNPG